MQKRIISLSPSITEILYGIGAEESIAAVSKHCDFPEKAAGKPKISGWADVRENTIMQHKPDILFTSSYVQQEVIDSYRKLGVRIEPIVPTTLVGILFSIRKIGKLAGKEANAEKLVAAINKGINTARKKSKFVDRRPRLYIEEWNKPPTVAGNWVPTLAQVAGANYSLIKAGHRSREVSLEEIRKYNPEYIVLAVSGTKSNSRKEWITSRKGWEELKAVKYGQVHVIDESLINRAGPRLVMGAEALGSIMHPE